MQQILAVTHIKDLHIDQARVVILLLFDIFCAARCPFGIQSEHLKNVVFVSWAILAVIETYFDILQALELNLEDIIGHILVVIKELVGAYGAIFRVDIDWAPIGVIYQRCPRDLIIDFEVSRLFNFICIWLRFTLKDSVLACLPAGEALHDWTDTPEAEAICLVTKQALSWILGIYIEGLSMHPIVDFEHLCVTLDWIMWADLIGWAFGDKLVCRANDLRIFFLIATGWI